MSSPGFLAVGGVEIANNARTVAYMQRGLAGPWFQTVQSQPCPDLLQEAWPLAMCSDVDTSDQYATDPRSGYRVPTTGAVPTAAGLVWDPSGWVRGVGQTPTTGGGFLPPNPGTVGLRVRLVIDVLNTPVDTRGIEIGRIVNPGTAQVGWRSIIFSFNAGVRMTAGGRTPLGNSVGGAVTSPQVMIGALTFEVTFTALSMTGRIYGGDPDLGAPLIQTLAVGYSGAASGTWFTDTGRTEADQFATVTEVGIVAFADPFPLSTDAVISAIVIEPNPSCVNAGDLYPSDTLWPNDDLYPGMYGAFLDPGTDNAPWADADRPEGYNFLGLLIDDIEGLDTTSDRQVDPSADGVGGVLGPETLAARVLTVKGWLIAADCSAMEYARRWLAETLAASLCAGCDLAFVDLRTTCGDDPAGDFNTNRWRLYDVGLTGMTTDTSNQEMCCFVTPVQFTLTAGNPYLYGPVVNVAGPLVLNAGGSDATLVPFETWLFSQPSTQCLTIADQGIGVDSAIFTFNGGSSGIEGGVVAPSMGLYPSESLWPGDCVYPADGATQWSNNDCPFAFTFAIGPGEQFVINGPRRLLQWVLADGTVLDGSPKMMVGSGDVIEWIDTCAGASIDACAVAAALCTCDDTATVQIQTQHRER